MISIPPDSKNPNGIRKCIQTEARPNQTLPEAGAGPDRTEPEARSQKPEAGKRTVATVLLQQYFRDNTIATVVYIQHYIFYY